MKRALSQVVGPPFFQAYEAADNLDDVDPGEDLLYGLLANQGNDPKGVFFASG